MKTVEELQHFYSQTLMPDLTVLEEKRKKIYKKLLIVGGVLGGIAVILVLVLIRAGNASALYPEARYSGVNMRFIMFGIFGLGGLGTLVYFHLTKHYVKEFKDKIIHRLVKFIDEGLHYESKGYIATAAFTGSQIFKRRPDRYNGDDLVAGKIGDTQVNFSEIHAEYRTSSGRNQTWHTIFKGLFFVADFNKHFTGKTVVLPDTAEKLFGHIGTLFQSWNASREELIKLEDPEFEKLFAVYGNDQIQARYILSTSLMRRIIEFKQKTKRNIYLSFVGSRIFVAVAYVKDLFEPGVTKTLVNFNTVQEYFEDLQLAIGIVEDLNLNTRIWSKQG